LFYTLIRRKTDLASGSTTNAISLVTNPAVQIGQDTLISPLDFLAGGGEMGERMRALDWTKTALGSPASWPQSLKTIVRVMLDSRYAMWMLWGPELTFFCNDAYLPTVGIKRDWVLGTRSDKVWEEIWPDIGPRIQRVLELGQPTWEEGLLLFLERSGFSEETYHTFSYSPVYDDVNRIAGMLCVVTEVSERVIGERRLRVLRDLATRVTGVETVQDACDRFIAALAEDPLDVPFACLYVLDATRERARLASSYGAIPERLRPAELIVADDTSPWPVARAIARNENQVVQLPNGAESIPIAQWSDRVSRAIVLPVQGQGSSTSVAVLIAGVSPRRALDDGYRGFFDLIAGQFSAALADAQAYQAERRRSEGLAEIDRAKTAFFSNVSHEFRTPLTLMLGPIAEAMENPQTPATVREQLELAHRNSLRLLKLVNSLLDFSRVEAGRVQASYEPTDLAALTRDLASTFRSAIERAGLRFTVECEALAEPVHVDREMWEKIVLNLLSNALKFTLAGTITVRLRSEGANGVLEVADTGIGIPEKEIPRVFERFHRVEGNVGRTQEGSGIGLALVQELVRLHAGTVDVVSGLSQGSVFRVRLSFGTDHLPAERIKAPRALASTATGARAYVQEALRWLPQGPGETASELPALRELTTTLTDKRLTDKRFDATAGARIVLADDNADMRNYVRELLSPLYTVEAVADGKLALEAARRELPDLILSDVMMPRLDGFGLLEALRSDQALRQVPTILLSARAGEESRIEGLDAGADDYLVKPFSARELLARVGALLERERLRRDALDHELALRRAAQALTERLELALSSMTDQFYMLDHEWRYTLVNSRVVEMAGLPESELIGRSIFTLFPDLCGTEFEANLQAAANDGISRRFEFWHERPQRWFENAVYPVRDGVAVLVADVTERKRVQESFHRRTAQFETLLNKAPMGVYLVDANFKIRDMNPTALADFGGIPQVIGRDFAELMHQLWPGDYAQEILERFRHTLETGEPHSTPERGEQRLDLGVTQYYEWQIHRITLPDEGYGVVCYFRDISAHIHARTALEIADRQKDEFLAMLAHELRNPLAPIRNTVELISRMVPAESRIQSALGMTKRQVAQLTRLVDDLLDVSRITQRRIELKRRVVELPGIIAHAVETVESLLREKRLQISIATSSYQTLHVHADPARLMQCIVNVLTNAAKYTDSGGAIRVQTGVLNATAIIEISDTGVGIAPDLLPRVFDLFVQGDRTLDRSQGGLGIGLSVVKRLVEMHEGEVTARSAGVGQGSTFEIRLPLVERPGAAAPETGSVRIAPSRLLIVDDNQDAADSLALLLELEGHEVAAVYTAQEALQRARSFIPSIVLLDIGLPEMDGYEVARRMRAIPELGGVRLIAITGYGQAEDRKRTREAGFDDHLTKPVDLPSVERTIAALRPHHGE
jgi:PAS domain S-box-containing protein